MSVEYFCRLLDFKRSYTIFETFIYIWGYSSCLIKSPEVFQQCICKEGKLTLTWEKIKNYWLSMPISSCLSPSLFHLLITNLDKGGKCVLEELLSREPLTSQEGVITHSKMDVDFEEETKIMFFF